MTKVSDNEVGGILDQLLAPGSKPRPETPAAAPGGGYRQRKVSVSRSTRTSRNARRGRPPGHVKTVDVPKEKLTVRIDRRLIGRYRDWSWEARCQLSDLVERALSDYHERSRQKPR